MSIELENSATKHVGGEPLLAHDRLSHALKIIMPIQTNQELHAAVRDIAERLDRGGSTQAAADLRDALAISSLPGEILGELRLVLRRIRSEGDLRRQVEECIAYIDRALGG